MTVADLAVAAEAALALAVADADYARSEWEREGRPLEQRTQNGMHGVHPLRKALVEADDRAARRRHDLVKLLGPGQRGRPPGAASARDRTAVIEPPKLQAV